MTDEVEVQDDVEDQGAFEAGFNAEPVEDLQPVQEQDEPAPVEASDPEEVEPAVEPERNQWGYTDEEMKLLLSKVSRVDQLEQQLEQDRQKIYGKLGEYNRTIQQLQSAKGSALTVRQLNSVRAEYPELAALFEKDLNDAQSAQPVETPPAQPAIDPVVEINKAKEELSRTYEKRFLEMQHPDWREATKTAEFRTWLGLQSPEYQQQLNNSWDSMFVAQGLTQFKSWAARSQQASNKKTARLERAVQPTGIANSGPPAMDDQEAFLSGFKAGRAGL